MEERWRDLDGEHVVSDQGRVAKLLPADRSHRYPRVYLGGERRYLHAVVAEAWHGPRPDGKQALHWDDDPDNPHASNIRWGTPAENAADAKRNRMTTARFTLGQGPSRLRTTAQAGPQLNAGGLFVSV